MTKFFMAIKVFMLAILMGMVLIVLLPGTMFCGTSFLHEIYDVLGKEFSKLRGPQKTAQLN